MHAAVGAPRARELDGMADHARERVSQLTSDGARAVGLHREAGVAGAVVRDRRAHAHPHGGIEEGQPTESRSTTKTSVSLGPITPPAPCLP
jgi:hypothetical protein